MHAKITYYFHKPFGVLCQNIDQVPQSHQIVIPFHGIPVVREDMLVVVPMTFLHQDARLDTPPVPCTQIATFMHIAPRKRCAGNPGMARFLGDHLGTIPGYLLPTLFTHHYVHDLPFPLVDTVVVFYTIDPVKALSSVAPGCRKVIVALKLVEPFILLPHAGKGFVLQDHHIVPIILMAQSYNGSSILRKTILSM
ncbi:MAG: hypothetical protein JW697_08930 [Kosmotogaceae bacterium]|nr:hypothetical protein [Kosmotogaceae bacterium]